MDINTLDTSELYKLFYSELKKFDVAKNNLELLSKEIDKREKEKELKVEVVS